MGLVEGGVERMMHVVDVMHHHRRDGGGDVNVRDGLSPLAYDLRIEG